MTSEPANGMQPNEGAALEAQLSRIADIDGVRPRQHQLLLFLLRLYYGVDELDSYEYVLEHREVGGGGAVDAIFVDVTEPGEPHVIALEVVSSPRDIGAPPGKLTLDDLELLQRRNKRVHRILADAGIGRAVPISAADTTRAIVLDFVAAEKALAALRMQPGLTVFDLQALRELAAAVDAPQPVEAVLSVSARRDERMATTVGGKRLVVCAVSAADVAAWPGIETRELFDLNVRFDLGRNRVRDSLEDSIRHASEHQDFLAYHNGLTVVCRQFDDTADDHVVVEDLSVVNGAQTVIALANNVAALTPALRLLVKFVEVGSDNVFAREVASRSNMQNPVTPRNWRALDNQQLRLTAEVARLRLGYEYITRPDAQRSKAGPVPINNDEAAQLLCAVYNERPWLAVKRSLLFARDNYRLIFNPRVSGAHIVMCKVIREAIQEERSRFSPEHRSAWRLTALTGCYLVGQILRASERTSLLEHPEPALRDPLTRATLREVAEFVAEFLAEGYSSPDFKVYFKNEKYLRNLGSTVRSAWLGKSATVSD